MSSSDPSNSLNWRITVLEREVERLKAGQPDVIAERVGTLSVRISDLRLEVMDDMRALRDEMRTRDEAREKQIKGFQRIFVTVFSGVGIAVAVAIIAQIVAQGGP